MRTKKARCAGGGRSASTHSNNRLVTCPECGRYLRKGRALSGAWDHQVPSHLPLKKRVVVKDTRQLVTDCNSRNSLADLLGDRALAEQHSHDHLVDLVLKAGPELVEKALQAGKEEA